MSSRAIVLRLFLSAAALAVAAPIGAAADDDGLFDAKTKKAILFYQNNLLERPTGVYEGEGWTFFQTRIPFDKTAKGRQAAQQAARHAHDRLLLRWMIDRSIEKGDAGAKPRLSPGASLVRDLVRTEEPAWEFESLVVTSVDIQQMADQTEGSFFVFASGGESEKLLSAVPEKLGSPWPTARWASAAKDAVRLRYRTAPDDFIAACGAFDLIDVRRTGTKSLFPSLDSKTFSADLEDFVLSNSAEMDGPGRDEAAAFSSALAKYVASSEAAVRIRERARALQSPSLVKRLVFSSPVIVEETNRVSTVETNWIDKAEISSNRTVRTLPSGGSLRGAVPYRASVFVERTSKPAFVVRTNETITIVRRTETRSENVCIAETGRPQFERLFLSAGTLPNVPAQQTDWGASAVSRFYSKGLGPVEREAILMDALGENPGDKSLWNFLGRVYQDRKDWIGAAICFRNALRLDPEFDYALTNLADCHKALGNMNLAVGTAVLARGLATNEWCEKRAAAILESPEEAFGTP